MFRYILGTLGALVGAISVVVFMSPFDIAPSGISGVAVLLNALFDLPIGVVVFVLNIPIVYLGYRMLPGGWQIVPSTMYIAILYAVFLELMGLLLGNYVLSDDRLLNALFGGVLGGVSVGMIYRAGMTYGGTSIIALILQRRTGMSMSTVFMYTDAGIVLAAGLVFGVEGALYALVVLFVTGLATDYTMEGPSVIRTAFIISQQPEEVSQAIISRLGRGATLLTGRGMYTGEERSLLYVTVARPQATELLQVVQEVDERAFIVIGHGHTAYGAGFRPNGKKKAGKKPIEKQTLEKA